nr:Ivy family C-type lysozyme inhibitor [Raoultella terrigena]
MKKILIASLLSVMAFSACADEFTVSDLAKNKQTQALFTQMTRHQTLPDWVVKGGTSSATQEVTIGGVRYQVLQSCKPHDCAAQSIAVLYSPEAKKMSGVFSSTAENGAEQQLRWLNVPDELTIDGKTVLFAALSGSLDNHPQSFNFK